MNLLPPWLSISLSAVLFLVSVALLVRIVRRRWRERRAAQDQASASTASAKSEAAGEGSGMETPAAGHSPLAPPDVPLSRERTWNDRKLFADDLGGGSRSGPDETELPVVHAEDVPGVDTSDYVFGPLTPALAALLPESPARREPLKQELRQAGYYQPHAWQNLAAIRYVGIMGALLLFGALLVLVPPQWEMPVIVLLAVAPLMAWAVPRLYVRAKVAERVAAIERAMPDLLDLLNMCVSQGLTVLESLREIHGELRPVYPELSQELAIVSEQAKVGSLAQALENFARRVDVPEVHSFTALLVQTERMGTSVSAALAEYSGTMRESLRQRSDTKANQASFKLLFPTVLCLMPAVYLFLLGPALVEVSNFMNGGGLDAVNRGAQAIRNLNQ